MTSRPSKRVSNVRWWWSKRSVAASYTPPTSTAIVQAAIASASRVRMIGAAANCGSKRSIAVARASSQ